MARIVFAMVLLAGMLVPPSLTAEDSLVRFEGGIGVIPARVGGVANTVQNVPPGGQPWVIAALSADVNTDGQIVVDGRGLLLGGGNGIGTTANQSVRARLFCGTVAHDSGAVALEPNGDFRIEDTLTPIPPDPCDTPVLLILNGAGTVWFAAGIPKLED